MIKIMGSIILICLLTNSIVSVNAFESGSEKSISSTTIYVDDDNTAGPWDGSLEHPYQKIIYGVENATEEDTIFVFNGLYSHESIYVLKSIKLIGENKFDTIIDGLWSIIQVEDTVNHQTINGFEIRNFMLNNIQAIYLYHCSNCVISENIITGNSRGIYLTNCSNSIVSFNDIRVHMDNIVLRSNSVNNLIDSNFLYGYNEISTGIDIDHDSNDCIISNNTVSNCEDGINVKRSDRALISDNNFINNTDCGIDSFVSSNSTISKNNIINNSAHGMYLLYSDDLSISDNIIQDNSIYGISLSYGKNIEACFNIIDSNRYGISFSFIENSICDSNTITNSSEIGIDIMDSGSIDSNNIISYNNVNNCNCGIMLDKSSRNTYKNNFVNYNEFGIMLYGATYFNEITKNEVRKNSIGIELYGYLSNNKKNAPFLNDVIGNNIFENTDCGIYATIFTLFNKIYYNNLYGNEINAYDKGTNLWYKFKILGKSMGNYWDDYTGSDNDGNGIGDKSYAISPWHFRNNDRFPSIEQIDIENI